MIPAMVISVGGNAPASMGRSALMTNSCRSDDVVFSRNRGDVLAAEGQSRSILLKAMPTTQGSEPQGLKDLEAVYLSAMAHGRCPVVETTAGTDNERARGEHAVVCHAVTCRVV